MWSKVSWGKWIGLISSFSDADMESRPQASRMLNVYLRH